MLTKAQCVDMLKEELPEVFQTKAAADRAFDAFCALLGKGMADSGVRLPGVGSFTVVDRAARTGRNPQTGKTITIAAKKVVKFSASKSLMEALNK